MEEIDKILRAGMILALTHFDNLTLAALNNAVQGFGRQVAKENCAYDKALKAHLIKEDGQPFDSEALKDACAYEVNRRVAAGTFN